MKLKILKVLPNIQVHYANKKHCIASKNLSILESNDNGNNWKQVVRLPVNPINHFFQKISLYSRLTRGGIYSIFPTANNFEWIVVALGKIFKVSFDTCQIHEIWQIERGRKPLRHSLCIIDSSIYFGEYYSNIEKDSVNIYDIKITSGQPKILYQFNPNTIRHIHVVENDPYTGTIWISTGDKDSECMVAIFNQESGHLEIIGKKSQKWRTLGFIFRAEAVYWGTDNHMGENSIWRFERATGETREIGKVTGPVYYNVSLKDSMLFGTTMEKGEGMQDGYGRLYMVDTTGKIKEILKEKKDTFNAVLFGYGCFEFAEGQECENQFWVTAKGFKGGLRSTLFQLEV